LETECGAPFQRESGTPAAADRRCRGHCRRGDAHRGLQASGGRRHSRGTSPPPLRQRSRATSATAACQLAPPPPPALALCLAAQGHAAAGVATLPSRRGARPELGQARLCPPQPVHFASAGVCPPSTLRVCVHAGGTGRTPQWPPTPQGLHPRAPGRSGGGHAEAASPAGGTGARGCASQAASRTEVSRVRTRSVLQWRAAANAHARPRCGRRLGGGAATRRAPAPSATLTRVMWDFPLAPLTWKRVDTGLGGTRGPCQSPRCSAVHASVRRAEMAQGRLYRAPMVGALWCG